MSNRDAYIAKIRLQLDALNAAMDELEGKTQEAKKDARDKYKAEIGELRQQSQLAIDKLDQLKAAGEDSWGNLVADTETLRDTFTHYLMLGRTCKPGPLTRGPIS